MARVVCVRLVLWLVCVCVRLVIWLVCVCVLGW